MKRAFTLIELLVVTAIIALLLGILGLAAVSFFGRWVDPVYVLGFLESLLRDLGETTASALATWTVCGLLLGIGYWLAQAQFLRIEVPAKATKLTLVDCLR